ncbi:hypothetical protein EDB89DRAFT_2231456 [Lactarius sanguifluus]|nr:hypothetical protein EDB89DRAFT_2231456 [Lactarius sanguifluus]
MSIIAAVARTEVYVSSRLKKLSIRSKMSISVKLGWKVISRKIQSWRRTPGPAKITFTGEKPMLKLSPKKDITRRVTVASPRVAENARRALTVVHLAVKHGKSSWGVAGLELRCERMSEEIPLGLLLVSSAPPGAVVVGAGVGVRADAGSSRRRTRSMRGAHQNQHPQDVMDTEEDGPERKRVARRSVVFFFHHSRPRNHTTPSFSSPPPF